MSFTVMRPIHAYNIVSVIKPGWLKMPDMKLQDMKFMDHLAGHENARYEIARHENTGREFARHDKYRMKIHYVTLECAFLLNCKSFLCM